MTHFLRIFPARQLSRAAIYRVMDAISLETQQNRDDYSQK